MKRFLLTFFGIVTLTASLPADTIRSVSPLSELDLYLRTLSLTNQATSNQQHMRGLAQGNWLLSPNHLWQEIVPGDTNGVRVTQFNSFNSSHPHGGNDGALWQGRGINSRTIFGWNSFIPLRNEFSLQIHLNPELLFSQNVQYDILPAHPELGSEFGNYRRSPDVPQRFGDSPNVELDPGDSEIRLNWRQLTTFVGTSHAWIGPAERNAIILSNNAPGYLKVGVGILPTPTRIGSFEAYISSGLISESPYFDSRTDNDEAIISLISISLQPNRIPGFTIGIHRSLIGNAGQETYAESLLSVLNPLMMTNLGEDDFDQRASITGEWTFPAVGFSVYGEWARNDYSPNYRFVMRAPGHSQAYTIGLTQALTHETGNITRFTLELSELVNSFDYLIDLGTGGTFYSHGIVNQGYAHRGQIIGAAIGSGADSQYLGIDHYLPWGRLGFFFSRHGRDKDFLYGDPANFTNVGNPVVRGIERTNVEIAWGISGAYLTKNFQLSTQIAYLHNMNWNWEARNDLHGIRATTEVRLYY